MRLGKIYGKTASRVSVKLLDIVIIIGIAAMAVLIPYLSAKGGFTVSFDSLGGTAVEAQRVRYGDAIEMPEAPTREDYTFEGWYYGDEKISLEEFNKLIEESNDGLIQYNGKYIIVDKAEGKKLYEQIANANHKKMTRLELIHASMSGQLQNYDFNYLLECYSFLEYNSFTKSRNSL